MWDGSKPGVTPDPFFPHWASLCEPSLCGIASYPLQIPPTKLDNLREGGIQGGTNGNPHFLPWDTQPKGWSWQTSCLLKCGGAKCCSLICMSFSCHSQDLASASELVSTEHSNLSPALDVDLLKKCFCPFLTGECRGLQVHPVSRGKAKTNLNSPLIMLNPANVS